MSLKLVIIPERQQRLTKKMQQQAGKKKELEKYYIIYDTKPKNVQKHPRAGAQAEQ